MIEQLNRQRDKENTFMATEEILNIGSIVNQALIDILIDKKIISAKELMNYIGKIRREDEHMMHRLY
jgi:hypothetical protein